MSERPEPVVFVSIKRGDAVASAWKVNTDIRSCLARADDVVEFVASPSQARELADWLIRAADWVDAQMKGGEWCVS